MNARTAKKLRRELQRTRTLHIAETWNAMCARSLPKRLWFAWRLILARRVGTR